MGNVDRNVKWLQGCGTRGVDVIRGTGALPTLRGIPNLNTEDNQVKSGLVREDKR